MTVTTFSIASDNDDGYCFYNDSSDPPNGGTFTAEEGTTIWPTRSASGGPSYENGNGFFRWNTGPTLSGGTVTAANLLIYVTSTFNTDSLSLLGDYYVWGGVPVVAGDWIASASSSILAATTVGSLTASAVNTIALTDLTGISTSGYTEIRLTLSAGTITAANSVGIAGYAHAQQEARLEVTYTAGATQILRPDADTTTTGWTTTPLFSKINEVSADGTIVTATAS